MVLAVDSQTLAQDDELLSMVLLKNGRRLVTGSQDGVLGAHTETSLRVVCSQVCDVTCRSTSLFFNRHMEVGPLGRCARSLPGAPKQHRLHAEDRRVYVVCVCMSE